MLVVVLSVVVVVTLAIGFQEPQYACSTDMARTLSSFSHLYKYVERDRERGKARERDGNRQITARMLTHTHTHRELSTPGTHEHVSWN